MNETTSGMQRLRALELRATRALDWLPPTVARLTLGWIFMNSGWGKLHNLDKTIEYFTSLNIPAANIQAPFAAGTEFIGGVLLLAGLATRVISIPLSVIMLVAIVTAKRDDISSLGDLFAVSEYLNIALFLYLIVRGAGPLSLDRMIARKLDGAASSPAAASPPLRESR